MQKFSIFWAAATVLLLPCFQVLGKVSKDTEDMARKWAPLVWLHPDEKFFPSNIDFYLEHMEVGG